MTAAGAPVRARPTLSLRRLSWTDTGWVLWSGCGWRTPGARTRKSSRSTRTHPMSRGSAEMLARPAVLEYAPGRRFRPVLALEPKVELSGRTAAGEPASLWMSGLLERGFTLVRSAGELPGAADGWLLQLVPNLARLLAPDDTVVYDGGLDQLPGWLDLVRGGNKCVVLIGTIGLYAYP